MGIWESIIICVIYGSITRDLTTFSAQDQHFSKIHKTHKKILAKTKKLPIL
jgi:hypothetical protein